MARAEYFNLREDYNKQAAQYMERRFSDHSGQFYNVVHREMVEDIFSHLVGETDCGLVVAPGPGRLTDVLLPWAKERLHVAELSDGMIREFSHNISPTEHRISLYQGDAFHLPFQDGCFNFLATFRFVHLFPLKAQVELLQEFFRVVQPGGYVVVEFNNLHYGVLLTLMRNRWKPEEFKETHISSGKIRKLPVPGRLLAVRGVGFPFMLGRLFPHFPRATRASYQKLGTWPLTRWMAQQLIAVWKKNEES